MANVGELLIGITDSVGIFSRVIMDQVKPFLPLKDVNWMCGNPSMLATDDKPHPDMGKSTYGKATSANALAYKPLVFTELTMAFSGPGVGDTQPHDNSKVLEWHNIPTLEIFVVTCESVEEYQRRFKEDLMHWIVRVNAQRPRAQTAVLFVPTASKSSAIRAVESTLNNIHELQPGQWNHSPSQQAVDSDQEQRRVVRFDMPSRGSAQSGKYKSRCAELVSTFADLALEGVTGRCFDIQHDMIRQESMPKSSWSVYSHFIVNERRAQLCSRLGLHMVALKIYDELSATLSKHLPGIVESRIPEENGVDIMSIAKAETRSKIAGESITASDFLSYIFVCKVLIVEKSGQMNTVPPMTEQFTSSLVPFSGAAAGANGHAWVYSVCDAVCKRFEQETGLSVAVASLPRGTRVSAPEEAALGKLLEHGFHHLMQLGRLQFGFQSGWDKNGYLLLCMPTKVIKGLRRIRDGMTKSKSAPNNIKSTNIDLSQALSSPSTFCTYLLRVMERIISHYKLAESLRKVQTLNLQYGHFLMIQGLVQDACKVFQSVSINLRPHSTWKMPELCAVLGQAACQLAIGNVPQCAQLLMDALVLGKRSVRKQGAYPEWITSSIISEIATLATSERVSDDSIQQERTLGLNANKLINAKIEYPSAKIHAGSEINLSMQVYSCFPKEVMIRRVSLYFQSADTVKDSSSRQSMPMVCVSNLDKICLRPNQSSTICARFEFYSHGKFLLEKIVFHSANLDLIVSSRGSLSIVKMFNADSKECIFEVGNREPQFIVDFLGHNVIVPDSKQSLLLQLKPLQEFKGGRLSISFECPSRNVDSLICRMLQASKCSVYREPGKVSHTESGDQSIFQDLAKTASKSLFVKTSNELGTLVVDLPSCSAADKLILATEFSFQKQKNMKLPVNLIARVDLHDLEYQHLEAQRMEAVAPQPKNLPTLNTWKCEYTITNGLYAHTNIHSHLSQSLHGCIYLGAQIRTAHAFLKAKILSATLHGNAASDVSWTPTEILKDDIDNAIVMSDNNFQLFWRCDVNTSDEKSLTSHLIANLTLKYVLQPKGNSELEKKFSYPIEQKVSINHLLVPDQPSDAESQEMLHLEVKSPFYGIVGCKAIFHVYVPEVDTQAQKLLLECCADVSEWMLIGKSVQVVNQSAARVAQTFELLPLCDGYISLPLFQLRRALESSAVIAVSKSESISVAPSGTFTTAAVIKA